MGGLVLDEALSHRRQLHYRDDFTPKRGAYDGLHYRYDFSVKTPQVRLVWKKRPEKCGIFDTDALTGASIFFSGDMIQLNREADRHLIPHRMFSCFLRTISDFKTSRHYLAGLSQTHLPAFACKITCREVTEESLKNTGLSLWQEWRLVLEP